MCSYRFTNPKEPAYVGSGRMYVPDALYQAAIASLLYGERTRRLGCT